MKRKTGLFMALAMLGVTLHAGAQTADEIVQKHIAAIGGDAWKKVTSLKATAKMNMMGQDMSIVQVVMPGTGIRRDIEMNGQKGYNIVTPTAGWSFMPMIPGQDKVMDMPREQVEAGQSELKIGGALYNAKSNGTTVSLLGKEELDGKPVFKLKLAEKEGDSSITWVDAQTYYVVRKEEQNEMMGQSISMESTFGDYKKLPVGIVVPGSVKQKAMGQDFGSTTFSDYEVNTLKDPAIFKP